MNDGDMTVSQAAELLGVTRMAVLQLIQRGILSTRRLGSSYVLRRADLLTYQESQQEKQDKAKRRVMRSSMKL
jgi:excisionase family DNA binding protein